MAQLATLVFLAGTYWPYLAAALVVGLVTGWVSFTAPRSR